MSKFFKALEQAERDRAQRAQAEPRAPAPPTGPPSRLFTPAERPIPADEPSGPESPPPKPPIPALPRPPADSPSRTVRERPRPAPLQVPPPVEVPEGVDDHLVSLVAPSGYEAEQYRSLRYTIEQRRKATGLTVIAVSSPGMGDGKTTTAINLAGSLAQAPEVRVLVVEADLRRPSIGRLLGFHDTPGRGLVDAILDDRLDLAAITRARPPFNLHFILAGQTPPSPYEILKSPRLGLLLDQARQQYDYILLDTPPIVHTQDCRVVMRWVDGILVVVAAHQTPRRLLEEAFTALDPTKTLGLVFNGDAGSLSYYGSRHYRAYHAGADPSIPGPGRLVRALGKLRLPFTGRARRPQGRRRRRANDA